MIIDCQQCQMRSLACQDCVVSVLLGPPGAQNHQVNHEEQQALGVLADSGLVPPLRLVVNNPTRPASAEPTADVAAATVGNGKATVGIGAAKSKTRVA